MSHEDNSAGVHEATGSPPTRKASALRSSLNRSTLTSRHTDSPEGSQSLLDIPRPSFLTHQTPPKGRPNRARHTLTPKEYIQSINAHSSRLLTSSSFPGNNYVDLANWLLQDSYVPASQMESPPHVLAVVYDLSAGGVSPQCFTESEHDAFQATSPPSRGKGQLLFIRGFLSPAWLSTIGSKYMLDPEFILRHLEFFAGSVHRHGYGLPSLSSTTNNIIKLCTSTIVHRDEHSKDVRNEKLTEYRKEQREAMASYRRQLRTRVRCGDSVVRDFSTVDDHHSLIEQWMSICTVRYGEGWAGIVWMDQGRDLAASPTGPWTAHMHANGFAFPVIQHHPKMTIRNTFNIASPAMSKDPNSSQSRLSSSGRDNEFPQSGCLLPLEYGSLLALVDLGRRCAYDHVLSLIPTFVHAAFSEVHLFNLMEAQIGNEIDALAVNASHGSIENLQFLSNILERHSTHTKDSLKGLSSLFEQAGDGGDVQRRWSESTSPKLSPAIDSPDLEGMSQPQTTGSGTFSVLGLKEDFRENFLRCNKLVDRCSMGIQTMMNKAMVLESHKAIEQAEDLKKLTLLASFFIPLSFVSSVFGMNFKVMGQGSLAIWWFFAIAIPVTAVAQIWYIWDSKKAKDWRKQIAMKRRHKPG